MVAADVANFPQLKSKENAVKHSGTQFLVDLMWQALLNQLELINDVLNLGQNFLPSV